MKLPVKTAPRYNWYNYLSMLGLKLNHVSKRGPMEDKNLHISVSIVAVNARSQDTSGTGMGNVDDGSVEFGNRWILFLIEIVSSRHWILEYWAQMYSRSVSRYACQRYQMGVSEWSIDKYSNDKITKTLDDTTHSLLVCALYCSRVRNIMVFIFTSIETFKWLIHVNKALKYITGLLCD